MMLLRLQKGRFLAQVQNKRLGENLRIIYHITDATQTPNMRQVQDRVFRPIGARADRWCTLGLQGRAEADKNCGRKSVGGANDTTK